MASDLRHKTPEQLRAEIAYQAGRLERYDKNISEWVALVENLRARLDAAEKAIDAARQKRNNHHQRLVWAKNYLTMKEPM
jgi:septal ring factor EnvC (AmiA/AmiB activator)